LGVYQIIFQGFIFSLFVEGITCIGLLDNLLTNQLAVSQVTLRSVKSRTGQLLDCSTHRHRVSLNHGQIIIDLYTKQKPNTNPNHVDC